MTDQCKPNLLIERLFFYSETNPARDAIVTPTFTLSYSQLAQLVRIQVTIFNDTGISDKSVIGIKCSDDIQHLVSCLAAIHVGATSCTIPTHETKRMQEAMISRCGATHVVDETIAVNPISLDDSIELAPMKTHAPEARLLFATSGTTGEPKLVVHHDSDIVAQAHRHVGSDQERFACLASMEHNFAKRHRLYCVAAGATNVFVDADQQSLVDQYHSLNINVMHVSAFQAQELLAAPNIGALSDIRLKLGGSHVPLTLRQQLRSNITNNLQAGYGTTETGAIAFTDPSDTNAGESVGQPLPGIEIRVVSAERKPLATGEHGELAIRCSGIFREYLGKSELTSARLEDGWFYSGDIGYLDKQNRIHLCGRSDDMFVFNSMNIYPQDIESQICQNPDIADVAVLPKKSSVHGNIPIALVVFSEGVKPNLPKLKKLVREQIGVRSPRQFTVVDKIPRNAVGKISRNDVMNLSVESDQVRSSIVQVLIDARAIDNLKTSVITAFENGEKNIKLSELGMDSLARMELLIMLETDYDTIIMPEEFARFRSLGDFVSRVLTSPTQNEPVHANSAIVSNTSLASDQIDTQPYIVRFFQRTFSYCHTVAQLNKALTTLERRLTPVDVEFLIDRHHNCLLISSCTIEKFQVAVTHWLLRLKRMMLNSGKSQPEPFVLHKIASTVIHFIGPGSPAEKSLLICFSTRGGHNLMIPNSVLMQHTDAARYDLLLISEPLGESYRLGVPSLGNNVFEVVKWISKLDLIADYNSIRTLGSSAGGYPAVIAGYLLGAEMAVSVAARFPFKRHPLRILNRVLTTWRAMLMGQCARVIMSYARDKVRDRKYAKIMAKLCGTSLVAVKFTNEKKVGHRILERLVERGELAPYFARTIFAEMDDELITTKRANMVMHFPSTQILPRGIPINQQES